MTLASQGIFLPKKQLEQAFSEAAIAFKYVAKKVRGQVLTQQFNDKAFVMQGFANTIENMDKATLLDALENMRHSYYEAADSIAEQHATCRLLKLALATHDLAQKERRNG